jgi:hypothetical protein
MYSVEQLVILRVACKDTEELQIGMAFLRYSLNPPRNICRILYIRDAYSKSMFQGFRFFTSTPTTAD